MRNFLRETDDFFRGHMPDVTRRFFYGVALGLILFTVLMAFAPTVAYRLMILSPDMAIGQFHLWQFFTYAFAHEGIIHFLFNVIGLFFFGSMVENRLGSARMFWFYTLTIIAAGAAHVIAAMALGNPTVGLIGISGAVYAVIVAAAMYYPRMTVLFFFFPVQMRVLALFFGVLAFVSAVADLRVMRVGGGVSNLAHAAGFAMGFLLVKFPGLLAWADRVRWPRGGGRRRRRGPQPISMGHPGRHSDPDDRYNDPHWRLDQ